jgi:hypothetical protein
MNEPLRIGLFIMNVMIDTEDTVNFEGEKA